MTNIDPVAQALWQAEHPHQAAFWWAQADQERYRGLARKLDKEGYLRVPPAPAETCPHGVRDPRACHKCTPGDGARSL